VSVSGNSNRRCGCQDAYAGLLVGGHGGWVVPWAVFDRVVLVLLALARAFQLPRRFLRYLSVKVQRQVSKSAM